MGSIVGVLLAGLIGMMAIPTLSGFMKNNQDSITAAAVAEHQTAFNTAVEAYVKQNTAALQSVATATTPATITVAMLQAPGVDLLPVGFNSTNLYGQTWQAQVLEPTAGNLQVLAYSVGGEALQDAKASKIASLVKPVGGFIPTNDSGLYTQGSAMAQGSFGKWTASTANYGNITGGHLATLITLNNGQLGGNYLYRNAIPGQPQLNQMNTPLLMASIQTIGAACSTNGAIAQEGTGVVISCQSGSWQQQGSAYWKDPVATYATLPTCNAAAAWQTRVVQTPSSGTGPRAYTCTGATWAALSVDDAGNLNVYGTASVGKVQVNDVVVSGGACASTGLLARDSAGLILSCQSNIWRSLANCGIGCGQTWVNLTNQRGNNATYVNDTDKPIMVIVGAPANNSYTTLQIWVNGVLIHTPNGIGWYTDWDVSFIVPPGHTYRVYSNTGWNSFAELR